MFPETLQQKWPSWGASDINSQRLKPVGIYIYNTYIYIYMLVSDPHIGVDERNSMESLDHEEEANWTMDGC